MLRLGYLKKHYEIHSISEARHKIHSSWTADTKGLCTNNLSITF